MTAVDLQQMMKKLDGQLVVALEEALGIAVRFGHEAATPEHWILALADSNADFAAMIEASETSVQKIRAEAQATLQRYPRDHQGSVSMSPQIVNLCREAWMAASLQHASSKITLPVLLYTLVSEPEFRRQISDTIPSLKQLTLGALETLIAVQAQPDDSVSTEPDRKAKNNNIGGGEDFIGAYTIDMTQAVRNDKPDAIIGRDTEMRQMLDILLRRYKNNPILVGQAGVGKTAIAEALAIEIVAGNVPDSLKDVSLLNLDLALLQAGASVKGEFERRLKGVIQQVKQSPTPIILFIDEAHTLIGAGGQEGQNDAANLVKPALARGELRTIAATTWSEYKKYFEKDAALARRFELVTVKEPDEDVAVQMIRSLVPMFEAHHGVTVEESAVQAAVHLSKRYIQARQLPDKAVGLLDTACSSVSISRAVSPAQIEDAKRQSELLRFEQERLDKEIPSKEIKERLKEITQEVKQHEATIKAGTERLEKERALVEQMDQADSKNIIDLNTKLQKLQGESPFIHRVVDRETIAAVVARWTGVPVGKLLRSQIATVQTLEDRLQERVIGQDRALHTIADAMVTARASLGDERKPTGVFLMVGTSGVGKTETALALADTLYGGEQNLTTINMSEFKEEHKVSLLMGSPPGYVGYGEGGVLTEAVRRMPYGVLLLDEIDKAHPSIQDVFYQVFDKGTMQDGQGRTVDFKNTTIMITANTGTQTLTRLAGDMDTFPQGADLGDALQDELLTAFKPAFLGRVSLLPYLPLSKAVLTGIANIQISKLRDRLAKNHKADLTVSDSVVDALVARSEKVTIGARAIETTIAQQILPVLSRKLLEAQLNDKPVKHVAIDANNDNTFSMLVSGRNHTKPSLRPKLKKGA